MRKRHASNASRRCGAAAAMTMLASPTPTGPSRWTTASVPVCHRSAAVRESASITLRAIGSYASYSRPMTSRPRSLFLVVPMKSAVPPHAGSPADAATAPGSMTARVNVMMIFGILSSAHRRDEGDDIPLPELRRLVGVSFIDGDAQGAPPGVQRREAPNERLDRVPRGGAGG